MLWVLSLEPFTQIQSKPAPKARFLPGIWSMFVALLHCSIYGWLSVFAPFPQRVSSFSSYPASSKVFSCMNECSGSINWLRRNRKSQPVLQPCTSLRLVVSRDWRKDKHRQTEKLDVGGQGSQLEKAQYPGSSACLLWRVEQGGRAIKSR